MLTEIEIKAMVLNRLLQKGQIGHPSSLVFNEMNLAGKTRRVDLGYISDGEIVAIEVKSDKDSLYRLTGQIEEYRKYFDRIVLAIAPKFVNEVRDTINSDIAIWAVYKNSIKVIRRGRLNRDVNKKSYLELMTKREITTLAKMIGLKTNNIAMYELKQEVLEKADKISKKNLKAVLLDGLHKRFALPSNRFVSRVRAQGVVSTNDVPLLSPYKHTINPPTPHQYL